MTDEDRSTMVGGLWFFCTVVLVALFIGAGAQGELTLGHILLAVVILALAVVGTPFALRWQSQQTNEEKTKRSTADQLLSGLSDEELSELRRRLLEHDHNEDSVLDYLTDDGEMVNRR